MLLNICLALCTLNYSSAFLYLKAWSPVPLKCHPSVLFSLRVFTFPPPFFLLKPWANNCFSLNKGIFVCLFSTCGDPAHNLSRTLATLLSVFSSVLYFPGHGAQVGQLLGLGLVDTALQSTHAELQDVGSNIWFALSDFGLWLLASPVRHTYWWSSMYGNNSSRFGFWRSVVEEAADSTSLKSTFLPVGCDLSDISLFWAQAPLLLTHWVTSGADTNTLWAELWCPACLGIPVGSNTRGHWAQQPTTLPLWV